MGVGVGWDCHVAVEIPSVGAPSADVVVWVAVVALAIVAGGAQRALSAGHSGKARVALRETVSIFSGGKRW